MELEVMRAFASRKSDQELGMPDVEQELARLKARRSDLPRMGGNRGGRLSLLRKVAAILVAALMLTGLSYAAVRTSFFTKSWEAPTSSTQRDTVLKAPATSSREQESSPSGELERGYNYEQENIQAAFDEGDRTGIICHPHW